MGFYKDDWEISRKQIRPQCIYFKERTHLQEPTKAADNFPLYAFHVLCAATIITKDKTKKVIASLLRDLCI